MTTPVTNSPAMSLAAAEWRRENRVRPATQAPPERTGEHALREAPLPLFVKPPPAEPFPLEALGALAPAAKAIASKIQLPDAAAAQSVLAVASLATQAHANVRLPHGPERPLSLFFATILGSGDRKSSADAEAAWPIEKRESFLRDVHKIELHDWKIASAAWHAEKRKIEADKNLDFAKRRARLEALGEEPPKPLSPFLVTGDITLEGLTKNWGDAHPALGIFTAEGAMFTGGHGMSEDARLRTAAGLNQAWDGSPIKRIRAADGATILPGRRLAVHLMIQPETASEFFTNPVLRDVGLLSRFLVAAPLSLAGSRNYRDPELSDDRKIHAFGARILEILETPATMAAGSRNELSPRALLLSDEAAVVWKEFFNHIESQSGDEDNLAPIRDFASKAAEHAARIAGVLAIYAELHAEEINASHMASATVLADWYVRETLRLNSSAKTAPHLKKAAALLEWLKRREPNEEFSVRNVMQLGPNAIREKREAESAIQTLLSHNWIFESSKKPRSCAYRLVEGARGL